MITVSKEDYLKAILEAESEGESVISARLADWLKVSPPAVTMALRRLKKDGLVRVQRDGHVALTASGRKIELPFLCQVVFSTNLSPTELVDEAFLRRMAYKIGIGNPSPEAFARILRYECDRQGVPWDEKAVGYLLNNLYGKKPLRGSHPRALMARLVDLANYRQQPPRLTPQSLKEAFDACFNPALGSLVEDDWARPAIG